MWQTGVGEGGKYAAWFPASLNETFIKTNTCGAPLTQLRQIPAPRTNGLLLLCPHVTWAAVCGCARLVPPQEEVTETKQLSQRDRSQRRVSLAQQTATRMEKTLLGRLFESRGLQKGLEEGEI